MVPNELKTLETFMPYFILCHKNQCVAQAHKFLEENFWRKKLLVSGALSAPRAAAISPPPGTGDPSPPAPPCETA